MAQRIDFVLPWMKGALKGLVERVRRAGCQIDRFRARLEGGERLQVAVWVREELSAERVREIGRGVGFSA